MTENNQNTQSKQNNQGDQSQNNSQNSTGSAPPTRSFNKEVQSGWRQDDVGES